MYRQFFTKWNKKPTDLMIGNQVNFGEKTLGFAQDNNTYYFVKEGKIIETKELTKKELATQILLYTEKL